MQELPHHYKVGASAAHDGGIVLESEALQPIKIAAPQEFGGPGNLWSPETMLAGAVASCFILTFRGVARASSFPVAEPDLRRRRPTGAMSTAALRFTEFTLRPTLKIPARRRSRQGTPSVGEGGKWLPGH